MATEEKQTFLQKLGSVFARGAVINDELCDSLEEILITADIGVRVTDAIIVEIKEKYSGQKVESEEEFHNLIKDHMVRALEGSEADFITAAGGPTVMLFVGVNGTGKTTSIGKLAHRFITDEKKVIMGAGDTFRAAAGEQLARWAERTGADIVAHTEGGDPAAVIFDAVEAGIARGMDYILLDTAGRLHTKQDLMKQLEKINRVIKKKVPEAPHEVILVIDATAGQNGLAQAKQFYLDVGVTGIFLAKMDGTAKGGIVFAIQKELGIPVKFIGTGESAEDFRPFDRAEFIDRIFFDRGQSSLDSRIDAGLESQMTIKKERKKGMRPLTAVLLVILVMLLVLMGFTLLFWDMWFGFIGELLKESHILEYFE